MYCKNVIFDMDYQVMMTSIKMMTGIKNMNGHTFIHMQQDVYHHV